MTWKKSLSCITLTVLALFWSQMVGAQNCECICGVGTPGYWENHPEAWPVEVIEIGLAGFGITYYSKDEAIDRMNEPVANNKANTLFKALVAAKLNIESCAATRKCISCISETVYWADFWMAHWDDGIVRANSETWQLCGEGIYWLLDDYNNGLLCAPSRDSIE